MNKISLKHLRKPIVTVFAPVAFGLIVLASGPAAQAQSKYNVFINTSSAATATDPSGYIDIQFNPGNTSALGATVTVTGFTQTFASHPPSTATPSGGVSGALPDTVTFTNRDNINELLQDFTYGDTISFVATFSGPALTPGTPLPASGTTFSLALYGADGFTPLLTTSSTNELFDINLNPNGSTSVVNYSTGGSAVVTPSLVPAPEPSGLLCALLGVGGIALLASRKRQVA